eukprot:758188-Hanusia_phi.AAC.2
MMDSSPRNVRQSTQEGDLARTHTHKAKKKSRGSHGRKAPDSTHRLGAASSRQSALFAPSPR